MINIARLGVYTIPVGGWRAVVGTGTAVGADKLLWGLASCCGGRRGSTAWIGGSAEERWSGRRGLVIRWKRGGVGLWEA